MAQDLFGQTAAEGGQRRDTSEDVLDGRRIKTSQEKGSKYNYSPESLLSSVENKIPFSYC